MMAAERSAAMIVYLFLGNLCTLSQAEICNDTLSPRLPFG
jgi:hypothetical protein